MNSRKMLFLWLSCLIGLPLYNFSIHYNEADLIQLSEIVDQNFDTDPNNTSFIKTTRFALRNQQDFIAKEIVATCDKSPDDSFDCGIVTTEYLPDGSEKNYAGNIEGTKAQLLFEQFSREYYQDKK